MASVPGPRLVVSREELWPAWLRNTGARTILSVGAIVLATAVALRVSAATTPLPTEPPLPARPIENATCAEAARIVREPNAAGRRLRIVGRFKLHVAAVMPDDRTTFAIDCDDEHFIGSLTPTGGEDLEMGPGSAIGAQVDRRGYLRVLGICMSCTSPSFSDDNGRGSAFVGGVVAPILYLVAMFAFALSLVMRRGGIALTKAVVTAHVLPIEAAPFVPDRVVVRRVGGEPNLDLGRPHDIVARGDDWAEGGESDVPRISVMPREGYRHGGPSRPELHGPGAVNGIPVRGGERFPLVSGDIVRLGDGPRYRVTLLGDDRGVVRYRADASGRPRIVRFTSPGGVSSFAWLALASLIPAVGGALYVGARTAAADGTIAGLGIVALLVALIDSRLTPARARPFITALDERLAKLDKRRVVAVDSTAGAAWSWHARGADGGLAILEEVPRASRFASAEELALRAALRREAELLSENVDS